MISNNYTYDLSGNPQKIYFTNGSITKYVYSATGQKLRMVHYTAKANITRTIGQQVELKASEIQSTDSTDYLLGGSLVVRNGKIDKYLFDGGYAQATASGTTDKFTFYYQNKDHLGTVRETVTSTGAMKQRVNYYPFGGQLVDTLKAMVLNRDAQPYKYNGKEFDGTFGLNTYDYGARQHYPVLARWDRIDPHCEKYYGVSPYAYCGNNPMKFVDLRGDSLSISGNDEDVNSTLGVYNQGMGGYYQATVDSKGNVSLTVNPDMDPSKMTDKEKTVYDQLNKIINSSNMTTINIVNGSSDVIIGSAVTATVDIGDVKAMQGALNSDPVATLMHETNEQSFIQDPTFHSNDKYRIQKAHFSAEALEHSYTGNIGVENILNINNNSGYLEFRNNTKVIEKKQIYNGNLK